MAFGSASIAQSVLSLRTKVPDNINYDKLKKHLRKIFVDEKVFSCQGNFFSINWGWGLGALLGVLVSGGVSGGHLNPAISVALASVGRFPWRKVPHYLCAQYLGALAGAGLVFLVYWDALVWYEHDRAVYRSVPETAAIFTTFPGQHLSNIGGAFDQVA